MNPKEYFLAHLFLILFTFIFFIIAYIVLWIIFPNETVTKLEYYNNIILAILMVLFLYPATIIDIKRWKDFWIYNIFLYPYIFIVIFMSFFQSIIYIFPELNSKILSSGVVFYDILCVIFYITFQFIPSKKIWNEYNN